MVRNNIVLLVPALLMGAQLEAMLGWKTKAAEGAITTTHVQTQLAENAGKHVRDLPTAVRMLVPMPVEHHLAAVELFDRICLCFIDGASEDVRRAGLRFLAGLENDIDRCDGPLGEVWFRPHVVMEGVFESVENSLRGYFEEMASINKFMAEPAQRVISWLDRQKQRCGVNRKVAKHVVALPDRTIKQWSVPNGCWIQSKGEPFFHPTDASKKAKDFRQNIVDTIVAHVRDNDEDFEVFVSELEAHVNAPQLVAIKEQILDWVLPTGYHHKDFSTTQRIENAYFDKSNWQSPEYKKGYARFERINEILFDRKSAKGVSQLRHQQAARVIVEEELTVSQPVLERLAAQEKQLEAQPVVLALERKPGDVKAQLALTAGAEDDDEWMRTLLLESGNRGTLALPAPKTGNNAHHTGALVLANPNALGGWVDEDDSDLAEL